MWAASIAIAGILASTGAQAQEVPPAEPVPSTARRAIGAGAAIFPGVIVHGAGHFVVGDHETGWRLLAIEGVGLGLLAGGVAGLAVSGAAPELVTPFIGMSVGGASLFVSSAIADLYGVLSPNGGVDAPASRAPWLEAELGHRYVYDPVFAYRHFAVVGAAWRTGRWRFEPGLWWGLDDENYRARGGVAWRVWGPRPDRTGADGSYFELEFGGVHHRYGTERFSMSTGEIAANGRLDLRDVASSLAGSFAELGFGRALGGYHYDDIGTEGTELLLARFAYGMYLGHSADGFGELLLYYDHRHDGFAAGAKVPGLGSGASGHWGLDVHTSVWGPWGVRASAVAGSAYVLGLSLVHQSGGRR